MTELDIAADILLDHAQGDEEIEVYGLHRTGTRIDADTDGALRAVSRTEVRGVGVRVISDHRLGYASTSDLTPGGLQAVLDTARAHARLARPDPDERLPDPSPSTAVSIGADPAIAATPLDAKVALVAELARRATAIDPRVRTVGTASYQEERERTVVVSTCGVETRHERCWVELEIDVVGSDEHGSTSGYGYDGVPGLDGLDPQAVAAQAAREATALLGPRRPEPPRLPVLLAPEVVAPLLAAVGRAFTGPALAGRGPFAGLSGRSVATPLLTLVDDGLAARSPAAAPVDDEGVPRRRTPLIVDGLAVGELHSSATAPPGQRSTGNARRGSHRSLPVAAPTTLRLAPAGTLDTPAAVHVRQLGGEGAGIRALTGRVDVALVAHLVEDGAPAGALAPVPLSTTVQDLLALVVAVGNDERAVPGQPVLAPSVLLAPELL